MNIIRYNCTVNTTAKKNREIKYIVIHYTAGITSSGKSDENTAAWFSKSTTKASSDYIVDDDSVTQFNCDIPNRYSWHCGGSKYKTKGGSLYKVCTNANSIGIEICSSNKAKKVTDANDKNWYFTDAVMDNTVELVKSLMKTYDILAENVIRHYDVNGKLCPGIIGWNADSGDESEWAKFKKRIEEPEKDEYENLRDLVAKLTDENESLKKKLDEIKKIVG